MGKIGEREDEIIVVPDQQPASVPEPAPVEAPVEEPVGV